MLEHGFVYALLYFCLVLFLVKHTPDTSSLCVVRLKAWSR
jgi:hypothetical protein